MVVNDKGRYRQLAHGDGRRFAQRSSAFRFRRKLSPYETHAGTDLSSVGFLDVNLPYRSPLESPSPQQVFGAFVRETGFTATC
jgi:hypothetical protein